MAKKNRKTYYIFATIEGEYGMAAGIQGANPAVLPADERALREAGFVPNGCVFTQAGKLSLSELTAMLEDGSAEVRQRTSVAFFLNTLPESIKWAKWQAGLMQKRRDEQLAEEAAAETLATEGQEARVLAVYEGLFLETQYEHVSQYGSLLIVAERASGQKVAVPVNLENATECTLDDGIAVTDAELAEKFVSWGVEPEGADFETVVNAAIAAGFHFEELVDELSAEGFAPAVIDPKIFRAHEADGKLTLVNGGTAYTVEENEHGPFFRFVEVATATVAEGEEVTLCPVFCRTEEEESVQLGLNLDWEETTDSLSGIDVIQATLADFRLEIMEPWTYVRKKGR